MCIRDSGKARLQAKKIKEEDAKELSDLQNQTSAQLATKASVDDVNKLGTDVNGVRSDLCLLYTSRCV